MPCLLLALLLFSAPAEEAPERAGTVQGVVVDGTHGNEPLSDAVVVLRAGDAGALEPVAETRTDIYGKFAFDGVPLDPAIVYLPGADREGVHYPGERMRLNEANTIAHVRIVTFDAIGEASPLVARTHRIDIEVQQDVLQISETMRIVNPSRTTYVGALDDESAATLRLSVPRNFDRVTFKSEFYGRRFRVVDHQPVTDIPWPPGERELTFSYRVPLEGSGGVFRRSLDMPCSDLRVHVAGIDVEDVTCNLPLQNAELSGGVYFASRGQLPRGHQLELGVGTLPFPWMQCARWGSLVTLGALSATTVVVVRRRSITGLAERSR